MVFFGRKWGLGRLLLAWGAYWVAVIGIKLGPALSAAWLATRGPDDGKSSISFNWGSEAGLSFQIQRAGETLWAGTTSIATVVAWAVIPPLVLWIIWLRLGAAERSRERAAWELEPGHAEDLPFREKAPPFRERI